MSRFPFALLMCFAALPALAGEDPRPRLVGGLDLGQVDFGRIAAGTETRREVVGDGRFSIGSVAGTERMPLGGYTSYMFDDIRVSSSLKGGGGMSLADLSAAYSGALLGIDGTAQVTLGYEWGRSAGFSLNPAQAGITAYEQFRPAGDLSLSLSVSRDVRSGLSLGGYATAIRPGEGERAEGAQFSLGAGLGLKF